MGFSPQIVVGLWGHIHTQTESEREIERERGQTAPPPVYGLWEMFAHSFKVMSLKRARNFGGTTVPEKTGSRERKQKWDPFAEQVFTMSV